MLLRRVIEHVRAQNWFAVFLDFVIVVVGVFIGIQVANWNASRIEQSQSRDLLARMMSEASQTQQDFRRYRQAHADILDRTTRLALRLQDEASCIAMDDDLKILIWSIGDFPPPRFSLSTATQSLNTGRLALIRSAEIRDGVQAISDEMAFINRQWQRYIRIKQDTEQAVAVAAGVAVTAARDGLLGSSQQANPDRYIMLTPQRICGAADIIALVSNVEVTQQVYVGYLAEVQAALDAYLEILNANSANKTPGGAR